LGEGSPFAIEELEMEEPRADEILVRVVARIAYTLLAALRIAQT
jgi:Zn-dependent alcohol dehydrogenase